MGMLKREDVFVTTKLWNDDHDRVEDAMDDSLKVALVHGGES
jgi:diketogulonate reductase-like aldo/keto reductase